MRNLALFFFLLQVASPVAAARRVTIGQLEQILTAARGTTDAKLAHQLSDLELSERLNSARAARLSANLPGPNSRRRLVVLADMSAFLDLPVDEIPTVEKPDFDAQRKMITSTVVYISKTLHRLPNFYATRDTTSFRSMVEPGAPTQAVQLAGRESWKVIYSDGGERVKTGRGQYKTSGLTTNGEFGNVLAVVIEDAAKGNPVWSRWEKGAGGMEAVYRFAITDRRNSHYTVSGLPSAYQGEIAIDPLAGSIRRVVIKAIPDPGDLLTIANVAVEYGPVDLGASAYICPLKSIAVSKGTQFLWLNDVVFEDYHLFRSSMRILPTPGENP